MTHLAQFSSFFSQGELLCTQGLAYLLENDAARSAFRDLLSARAQVAVSEQLTWRAEVRQVDGGRPDLEGCTAEGKSEVKLEAKLGAALGIDQLKSYASDLSSRSGSDRGLLVVLVPNRRITEADTLVSSVVSLREDGARRMRDWPEIAVTVISWEETLDLLGGVCLEPFAGDLEQFHAMYSVLAGAVVPPTDAQHLLEWRTRRELYWAIVDRVTRRLTRHGSISPKAGDWDSYRHRYVAWLPGRGPYFSVGLRDPFAGHVTPIWLRFHHDTPNFFVVRDRLQASSFADKLVWSGKHIWIPLEIPLGIDGDGVVDSLVAQVEAVIGLAYEPFAAAA